jgi:hypothetical protein
MALEDWDVSDSSIQAFQCTIQPNLIVLGKGKIAIEQWIFVPPVLPSAARWGICTVMNRIRNIAYRVPCLCGDSARWFKN